jgi:hypothetical protein
MRILLATVLSASAFAQPGVPVSGNWSGSFDTALPDGQVRHDTAVLMLKQEGTVVTGSAGSSESQQLPIKDGKAEGSAVQFTMDAQGTALTFRLQRDGDRLIGEARGGTMAAKVNVVRSPGLLPLQALVQEISRMDGVLFGAYNRRDLETMKGLFTEDLEFYHDLGGLSGYPQNLSNLKSALEGGTVMRRELVEGSLEVHPIQGYGAVEIGVHRFYSTDPGQKERLTATAKFVHVWQKKDGNWKISRVVSYDHR